MSSKHALISHMKRHPDGENTEYKCDTCDEVFGMRSLLNKHARIHVGQRPFICEHCSRSFAKKSAYLAHLPNHSIVKPFECSECDQWFVKEQLLQEHIASHRGDSSKPHKCSHCHYAFSNK